MLAEWTCNSLNWLLEALKLCVSISLLWYRVLEFIVLILFQIKKGFCAHQFSEIKWNCSMLYVLSGTAHYVDQGGGKTNEFCHSSMKHIDFVIFFKKVNLETTTKRLFVHISFLISTGIVPMLHVLSGTAHYVDQGGGNINGRFLCFVNL